MSNGSDCNLGTILALLVLMRPPLCLGRDAEVHQFGCAYLLDCPKSRDQPNRGPAVALVPPRLNSVSDMSSGLNVVD